MCGIIFPLYAQQIVSAEYFFDADPGIGNGIPVFIASPADTVNLQINANVAGLSAGQHYLSVRTKDAAGSWSLQQSRLFYVNPVPPSVNQQVTQAEYFFDTDPGIGNGVPVSIPQNDTVISSFKITNPFTTGSHYLVMRTKDFDGNWSLQAAKKFNVCFTYGANSDFTTFNDRRTVYFNNISQYDTAFYWNFGDATSTTIQRNPVHQYAIAGIYNVSLISYNACATDTFTQPVTVNGIQSIYPAFSADTNFFIGHIRGLGFQPGCTIKLNRGTTTLIADSTIYISSTDLKVIFKFNHPPIGFYQVIADNPLGVLDTLFNAFEIQTLRPTVMTMSHLGAARARTGRSSTQSYTLRNDGNTTIYMIPVFIFYTDTSALSVTLFNMPEVDPNVPAPLLPLIPPDHTYPIPDPWNPELPSIKMVAAMIPFLGPGEEVSFGYKAQSSVPECWTVNVKAGTPMSDGFINPFTSACNFLPPSMKCIMDVWGLIPVAGCIPGAANFGCTVGNVVNDALWGTNKTKWYDIAANWGGMILSCVGGQTANTAIQLGVAGATSLSGGLGTLADCNEAINGNLPNPPAVPSESTTVCWSNSYDPNEKYGPKGITTDNYVNKYSPLSYEITFENVDTATAPAAEVIITDSLDITMLDLSTFRFTHFGFGDTLFVSPDEITNEWITDIDLRASGSIWLRSNAFLDLSTGIITWKFTSYDTTTFDLVSNPLLGFLPPNVNAPEGEGFIGYSVNPKASLLHGDVITNRASIVFDNNAPVLTSDYINTIDTIKPSSVVLPLAATQTDSTFRIHFSGSDAHAGVKDYFIYASVNGDIYKLFASGCPYDSLLFTAGGSNQYEFFSQARDRAHNLEDTLHVADAVTLVTVGMDELPEGMSVDVFPNPATVSLDVIIKSDKNSELRIQLFAIDGKQIVQFESQTNERIIIPLSGIRQGLYYMKIEAGNKQFLIKKIIVLK